MANPENWQVWREIDCLNLDGETLGEALDIIKKMISLHGANAQIFMEDNRWCEGTHLAIKVLKSVDD